MVNIHNYDDIIEKEYQKSTRHSHMARIDRAAQFAPFAALTGHKESIYESARITSEKKILDENQLDILNHQLQIIQQRIHEHQRIKITYFVADCHKNGGEYVNRVEEVKKIDEYEGQLIFVSGLKVSIDDIYDIELI